MLICRICLDDEETHTLLTPCRCDGSSAYVHESCLMKWLQMSEKRKCEICLTPFILEYNRPLEELPRALSSLSGPAPALFVFSAFFASTWSSMIFNVSIGTFVRIIVLYNCFIMAIYALYVHQFVKSRYTYTQYIMSQHYIVVIMIHLILLSVYTITNQAMNEQTHLLHIVACQCLLCVYPLLHYEIIQDMNASRYMTIKNRVVV